MKCGTTGATSAPNSEAAVRVGTTIVMGGDASDEPTGIEVFGSGSLVVSASSSAIDEDGTALAAGTAGDADVTVERSTIRLSGTSGHPVGIDVLGGGDLTLAGNRFELESTDDVAPQAVSLRPRGPALATIDANV